MRKSMSTRVWLAFAMLVLTAPLQSVTVMADDDDSLYRLEFQVTESKNGETANIRNYFVLARNGTGIQIRTENRVPIFPPDGVEYLSVGLHIDCELRARGNMIELGVLSEINSFVVPEQATGPGDPPVIRAITSHVQTAVAPGKRTMISSIDDVTSDSRYEVHVTVTNVE